MNNYNTKLQPYNQVEVHGPFRFGNFRRRKQHQHCETKLSQISRLSNVKQCITKTSDRRRNEIPIVRLQRMFLLLHRKLLQFSYAITKNQSPRFNNEISFISTSKSSKSVWTNQKE